MDNKELILKLLNQILTNDIIDKKEEKVVENQLITNLQTCQVLISGVLKESVLLEISQQGRGLMDKAMCGYGKAPQILNPRELYGTKYFTQNGAEPEISTNNQILISTSLQELKERVLSELAENFENYNSYISLNDAYKAFGEEDFFKLAIGIINNIFKFSPKEIKEKTLEDMIDQRDLKFTILMEKIEKETGLIQDSELIKNIKNKKVEILQERVKNFSCTIENLKEMQAKIDLGRLSEEKKGREIFKRLRLR